MAWGRTECHERPTRWREFPHNTTATSCEPIVVGIRPPERRGRQDVIAVNRMSHRIADQLQTFRCRDGRSVLQERSLVWNSCRNGSAEPQLLAIVGEYVKPKGRARCGPDRERKRAYQHEGHRMRKKISRRVTTTYSPISTTSEPSKFEFAPAP